MVFSSLLSLGLFLPVTLFLYFLSKNITWRNIVLLIASLIFYAWGEPILILVMLFSAFIGYIAGFGIDKWRGKIGSRLSLIFATVIILGLLGVYKYTGFFVSNINILFGSNLNIPTFTLPLGISFYSFQILSYVIDTYRGEAGLQKSYYKFLLYVTMFPQLVAGPIVRYVDIEKQINERCVTFDSFERGVIRFSQGMFKKVILANSAGQVVDLLIGGDLTYLSSSGAWLGIIMYAFQIYFDFSGYSDMAIGLGHFFGFDFKENFNYPYTSKSVTEFWRRWHMSLGSFFRDYVYIPLGGNRKHHLLNIFIVWFLTGFWHGASWNFILWGLYYGILLIIEKKLLFKFWHHVPSFFRLIYSNALVLGGWMLFYFTDMTRLKAFLLAAFGKNSRGLPILSESVFYSNLRLLILLFICSTPLLKVLVKLLREKAKVLYAVMLPLSIILIMAVCFTLLVKETYNPFLYFRF